MLTKRQTKHRNHCKQVENKLENLVVQMGQVWCLRHVSKSNFGGRRVTVTFDLLTSQLTASSPFLIDQLCQFAAQSVHSFSKYRVDKISNGRQHYTPGHWSVSTGRRTNSVCIFLCHRVNVNKQRQVTVTTWESKAQCEEHTFTDKTFT